MCLVFVAMPPAFLRLIAATPNAPLALADDIDFDVEYSTDELALGDVLYVRAIARNKSSKPVRFADFDSLVIRGSNSTAEELVCGFGELPGGVALLTLLPEQEVMYTRMLDVFGDDRGEDGKFDPFDATLEDTALQLKASRLTVMPDQCKLGYRAYQIKNVQTIQFGKRLVEKANYELAVEAELKRSDLQPLILNFFSPEMQTSFLFSCGFESYEDPRGLAACLQVASRKLPPGSPAVRLASIILGINQYVEADDVPSERQAALAVISSLGNGTSIEREYWVARLIETLNSATEPTTVRDGRFIALVSKDKYERFLNELDKAGMLPLATPDTARSVE